LLRTLQELLWNLQLPAILREFQADYILICISRRVSENYFKLALKVLLNISQQIFDAAKLCKFFEQCKK
jgi:hypothetical protein